MILMEEFCFIFWSSGRVKNYVFFEFDGNPLCCTPDLFINTVIPHRSHQILDYEDFVRRLKKHFFRGKEYEKEIVRYIAEKNKKSDVYILDTPSVMYVFTTNKAIFNEIQERVRDL